LSAKRDVVFGICSLGDNSIGYRGAVALAGALEVNNTVTTFRYAVLLL
jgi:hypothetical protein